MAECTLEYCTEPTRARGLCGRHYQQVRIGREPTPRGHCRPTRKDRPCTFDGCVTSQEARGLCQVHYAQRLRGEELRPKIPRGENRRRRPCALDGCDARGSWAVPFCPEHRHELGPCAARDCNETRRSHRVLYCDVHHRFNRHLMHQYGISLVDRDARIEEQGGRCAICQDEFDGTPHVDHRHGTEVVRGILCGNCNRALGSLRDSPDIARRAALYLERS